MRISRQGIAVFKEYMEKRLDPRNRPYYWQGADMQAFGRTTRRSTGRRCATVTYPSPRSGAT